MNHTLYQEDDGDISLVEVLARLAQLAEATDSKSVQCGFESHSGHPQEVVAQSVRAEVLYTSGRGFNPHLPH